MSESKMITVNIYGQDYMLKSEADEEYLIKIAKNKRKKPPIPKYEKPS